VRAVTGDPAELGAFRVPTLRNLRETGPYFHDGSVASLEEAVASEARRSAERGEGASLGDEEVARISVFLRKGLVDRTHEPARPREVPSGLDVPLDGFRVPR
jgi:cytochrome c peroxidase